MEIKLTKDADKLLCIIYKEYLDRRKNGDSKIRARNFGEPQKWETALLPEWDTADVGATVSELGRAALVRRYLGHGFILNDSAIVYMESRFPDGVAQVLDWMGKIKSAIPFA